MTLFAHCIATLNEAVLTKKQSVAFPANKIILKVLKISYDKGFIANFSCITKKNKIYVQVFFKPEVFGYVTPIRGINLISTPSSSVFVSYKKLLTITNFSTFSTLILTTNKGIITSQQALKLGLGGKLLCIIV